jgi:hypothetical protein
MGFQKIDMKSTANMKKSIFSDRLYTQTVALNFYDFFKCFKKYKIVTSLKIFSLLTSFVWKIFKIIF